MLCFQHNFLRLHIMPLYIMIPKPFFPSGFISSKRCLTNKCIYSVWSAGVWVAMIHTAVWESLGFTLPLALFTRITEHKWIKKSESHVAWFSLLCKNSHFPSKTKPGSDCYRPPFFAQASTLYTHLAYLWRTLPTTRNTQFSIKHYSSFKKAPAKPCNEVRNSNWISSLTFGEKKLRQNAWTKETAFPRTLQKISFLYLVLYINFKPSPWEGKVHSNHEAACTYTFCQPPWGLFPQLSRDQWKARGYMFASTTASEFLS